jgi:hypothetical protein
VLNVHAPTEDKIDDMKDRFYELEWVFDKFQKYHMKILLEDFNAKVGREDVFKPTTGNKSLHEISNDNGVRVANSATSKNLTVKSTIVVSNERTVDHTLQAADILEPNIDKHPSD